MKKSSLLFLIIILLPLSIYSQDTLVLLQAQDGSKRIHLYSKTDTLDISLYPNGKIETSVMAYPGNREYAQTRYYPNGKMMWLRNLYQSKPHGTSVFYSKKGEKILTINYENGTPVDTLVHTNQYTLVFGRYTFSSVVYGGMELENGQSNVQEIQGPAQLTWLKLVSFPPVGSKLKSISISSKTDTEGNFMFLLERKKMNYGIFPTYYKVDPNGEDLTEPLSDVSMSGNTAWNLTEKIQVEWNTKVILTEFKSSSVGYAP